MGYACMLILGWIYLHVQSGLALSRNNDVDIIRSFLLQITLASSDTYSHFTRSMPLHVYIEVNL